MGVGERMGWSCVWEEDSWDDISPMPSVTMLFGVFEVTEGALRENISPGPALPRSSRLGAGRGEKGRANPDV